MPIGHLRLNGVAEPDDLASKTVIGVFSGLALRRDEAGLRACTVGRRRQKGADMPLGISAPEPPIATRRSV